MAGITTTLGGLASNADARAAPGVYAAGGDAGGIATGGYASGLAAALVLGRVAAASALEDPMTFAFGSQFTVGIEEELLLVDPEGRGARARRGRGARRDAARERAAGHEAYAA